MKKIFIILLAVCLTAACTVGCNSNSGGESTTAAPTEPPAPTQILSKSSISFAFPEDFIDYTDSPINDGNTFLFANGSLGLIGNEVSKDNFQSFSDYIEAQALETESDAIEKDGFWTLTYVDNTQNEPQTTVCVFYEIESSYWTVKAYCPEDVYSIYQETLWKYITSATFE